MNFMRAVKKNAEGCILEYARASFYFGVSYFLEHKRVGMS